MGVGINFLSIVKSYKPKRELDNFPLKLYGDLGTVYKGKCVFQFLQGILLFPNIGFLPPHPHPTKAESSQ